MKQLVYFFLFSSLFISFCSVALCIQTNLILNVPLNSSGFYLFIFGSTLVQYNLHYLSKPLTTGGSVRVLWSARNRKIHYFMLVTGACMIFLGLFSFRFEQFVVLGVLGAVTFLYSFPYLPVKGGRRLKDFGVIKILSLTLVWAIVTVWLPVSGTGYNVSDLWQEIIRRSIFVFILCLIFDVRDIKYDSRDGIRTIPVLIGKRQTYILAYVSLLIFVVLVLTDTALKTNGYYLPLILSAFITFLVVLYSRRKMSDMTCLFGIDGMMLAQGTLVILFSPVV